MSVTRENQELIELYAQMAALTAPECAHTCRCPHSCCSAEYCEQAIEWAQQRWGVQLERANGINLRGEVLPLLGPAGCTAAPHFRPICTLHTCEVNSLGGKRGDPAWTQRYFELREALEEREFTAKLDKQAGHIVF